MSRSWRLLGKFLKSRYILGCLLKYAFLQELKSTLGKFVSGAWKKFKAWWDEHKRPEVEENARESVRNKLEEFKKQAHESKKSRPIPTKRRGIDIE